MKRNSAALIILIAAGLLANVVAPRLFMGFNYLFGSIPALIALRYFGIGWGTVVGVVAGSYTYALFGHPYAMVWLTAEIPFVGLLIRRRGHGKLVFYNTLYWPVVGIPLLWIFFKFVMNLPFVGTLPAALMFWFIGITNSLCAQILMDWGPLARWVGKPEMHRPLAIRRAVFHLMMVIVLLPAILVLVINGRTTLRQNEISIVDRVLESSADLLMQLKLAVGHTRDMFQDYARQVNAGGPEAGHELARALLTGHQIEALFLVEPGRQPRLLASSEASPVRPPSGLANGDAFVAKEKNMPQLIYLQTPVDAGRLIAATLRPDYIGKTFQVSASLEFPRRVTIVDRNFRIVYTNHKALANERQYIPQGQGEIRPLAQEVYHLLPPTPQYITLWSRVQRSWFARETPLGEGLNWTLILEIPFGPYQKMLLSRTSEALIVLLMLSLGTLAVSSFFSERLSRPIIDLAETTTGLARRIYEGAPIEWTESRLVELATLIENFKIMSRALKARFTEANDARRLLEDRVRERTEALNQARIRAELVYRLVPSAICAMDMDKKIVIWNDKAAEITGFTAQEVVGKTCRVFCSNFCDTKNCPIEIEKLQMPVMLRESKVLTKDGRVLNTLKNIDYMREPNGEIVGILESFEDITQRQQMEEQLRHAQKMQAIGTLTGGIAHDFNNLLSIILGYAEFLEEEENLTGEQKSMLGKILEASDRARSLTQNLLTFSRPQQNRQEPLELNQVVAETVTLLSRLVPETIELDSQPSNEPLVVFGDRGQISQVLINLVTNARDAIPEDGRITIHLDKRELDEEFCRIHKFGKSGVYAVLRISDTGLGMDAETRSRIFEPFYSTKGIGEGTGLGLTIIFGIIQAMNGRVNVYSEPGKGTTFTVMLPLYQGGEKALSRPVDRASDFRGHETILVAEDEKEVQQLVQLILQKVGYTVIVAADGEEAVDILRQHKNEISLALLDVIMPRLNGRQTAEALQRIRPDLPIIFMSGYTADILNSQHHALSDKYPLLSKPLIPREMLLAVRRCLDEARA